MKKASLFSFMGDVRSTKLLFLKDLEYETQINHNYHPKSIVVLSNH